LSGVIPGGNKHANSSQVRVQQHSSTAQCHQLVRHAHHCILGRHADQGKAKLYVHRVLFMARNPSQSYGASPAVWDRTVLYLPSNTSERRAPP